MTKHIIAYDGLVRVSLGLMQEQYVDQFVPWINKRVGIEGTLQRPPYSATMGIEWIRGLDTSKGKNEVFAVLMHVGNAKRPSYRYVGHMGIHRISDGIGTTGSVIGDPRGRGNGCGTEAKLLLQYHAFRVLGLRKLASDVKAFNAPSLGHLLKCGYQIVGRQKRETFHEGTYVDKILLEVFPCDWEPIWERYQKTGTLPKLTQVQKALLKKEITK